LRGRASARPPLRCVFVLREDTIVSHFTIFNSNERYTICHAGRSPPGWQTGGRVCARPALVALGVALPPVPELRRGDRAAQRQVRPCQAHRDLWRDGLERGTATCPPPLAGPMDSSLFDSSHRWPRNTRPCSSARASPVLLACGDDIVGGVCVCVCVCDGAWCVWWCQSANGRLRQTFRRPTLCWPRRRRRSKTTSTSTRACRDTPGWSRPWPTPTARSLAVSSTP